MFTPRTGRPGARRPAAIAVKVAVLLPLLFAVVALSFDGGLVYDARRSTQAAADAAALAAACKLFETYNNSTVLDDGKDPYEYAVTAARAIAAANGYPHDKVKSKVDVYIPPVTGPYTGQDGHAEVVISYYQPRGFSAIWSRDNVTVGARAVARGRWKAPGYGILCLDPTGSAALSIGGGAHGLVPNAKVIVNSNSTTAVQGSGGNATLGATGFDVTGGLVEQFSTQFNGPERYGIPPTPDPFRDVPEPNPLTMPIRSTRQLPVYTSNPVPPPTTNYTVTTTNPATGVTTTTHYLYPGVYPGGIRYTQDNVYLMPGVFYMQGGGFNFSGQGNLTALEVMLFNDPGNNNGSVSIAGQGTVKWTPPSTGTYQGMTLFQKRGATQTVSISGQGGMDITGALYVPDALLYISGNGDNIIGSQVVVWRLSLQGNGNYYVPWEPAKAKPVRELKLVE